MTGQLQEFFRGVFRVPVRPHICQFVRDPPRAQWRCRVPGCPAFITEYELALRRGRALFV